MAPISCPVQTTQNLSLQVVRRLAAFHDREKEINRLTSFMEMVKAVVAAPLDVLLHLCGFLRLQQAEQE
jgi:hypothetical protein